MLLFIAICASRSTVKKSRSLQNFVNAYGVNEIKLLPVIIKFLKYIEAFKGFLWSNVEHLSNVQK